MKIAYFDTSALLKRYVSETGSRWVNTFLTSFPEPVVFTSQLTAVETACAFSRRLRDGTLTLSEYDRLLIASDYDFTYRYIVADVIQAMIDTARQLAGRHPLRAYDALHLATAWLLNRELLLNNKSPLTFICADNRLILIARAEGLQAENPNEY